MLHCQVEIEILRKNDNVFRFLTLKSPGDVTEITQTYFWDIKTVYYKELIDKNPSATQESQFHVPSVYQI